MRPSVFLALALLALPARADDVVLKNGNRLVGQILSRKDGKLTIKLPYGTATLRESEVAQVVLGPTPWEEYATRKQSLRRQDTTGHLDLARWCEELGLRSERDDSLMAVLKVDPDNADARQMRGEIQVHGIWVPERVGMQAKGFLWHKGEWRKKADVEQELATREAREAHQILEKKVRQLAQRMGSRSSEKRREARDALVRLAKDEELPHLAAQAEQLYDRYESWWVAHGHAIVEARLQQATITNVRRRSVSLGTGTPVTLELPEVRTIKIGTTVGVPFGR